MNHQNFSQRINSLQLSKQSSKQEYFNARLSKNEAPST